MVLACHGLRSKTRLFAVNQPQTYSSKHDLLHASSILPFRHDRDPLHLRALRWVQRNAIASAFVAVLMAGLGATLWQYAAAEENAAQLATKIAEFDQLAVAANLEAAIAAEEDLYPAWPEKIDPMERWLRQPFV